MSDLGPLPPLEMWRCYVVSANTEDGDYRDATIALVAATTSDEAFALAQQIVRRIPPVGGTSTAELAAAILGGASADYPDAALVVEEVDGRLCSESLAAAYGRDLLQSCRATRARAR